MSLSQLWPVARLRSLSRLAVLLFAASILAGCSAEKPGGAIDGGAFEQDGGSPDEDGGALDQDGGAPDQDGGARIDGGLPDLGRTPIQSLYIEPRDDNTFLTSAIGAARTSIDAVLYILTDNAVERALRDAKRRGVRVRVILDTASTATSQANASAKAALLDGGVQVQSGPSRFTNVHQKTVVVDNARAFVMTLNPSSAGFGSNREYAVEVRNAAELADMRALFEADWANAPDPALSSPLVISSANSRARIANLLRRAHSDLLFTVEVFADSGMRNLLSAIKSAGVRVRILLADPRDVDTNATNAQVLKSYGFEVKFLQRPTLHAKLILVDGALAYLGSINMTQTSLDRNREVGVIIDDANFVRQLKTQAEADWSAGVLPDGGV